MEVTLIVLVLAIGFYMLWNIGANDVANAVGTSVGSGAITLKKAIFISVVLEFTGAVVLGSNVSETIQTGIIDPSFFASNPMIFVLGMCASLFGTAVWLQVATYCRWPVSTTHAIVGAVLGFGAVIAGVESVHWEEVGTIVVSWFLSPSLSALAAYLLFVFVQKKILFSFTPLLATKKIAPMLIFLVLFIFVVGVATNGIENLRLQLSLPTVLMIATSIGAIGAIVCHFACERIRLGGRINPIMAARQETQIYTLQKVQKHLMRAKLVANEKTSEKIQSLSQSVGEMIENLKTGTTWESHITSDYQAVEKIFASMQILTACFVAFSHGANDVANAIGPVSAVLEVVRHPDLLASKTTIPIWLLGFGGLGIVFGLATYGWRVIETIGNKITQLTPTRGFCAEFAAAATILVASKLGLPISTTHSIVGAVLGVGLARGLSALNFKLIRDIFLSWVITIPCSAIATILFFYLLKLFFM